MAEQRLIDANELYGVESLLNTDIVKNSKEASYIISQVLHDIQTFPTIDPEDLPIVRQLREELVQYKDLGVTPKQIALLMKFFKDRTSAKWIAADMELVADSIRKSNLEKQLARVTAEKDAAVGLLKRVNDETGNCYGCKYFDIERRACTDREKKVSCDCRENNMWEWRGPQKEE